MIYLDTSVLLKLYIQEPDTEKYYNILARLNEKVPFTSLHRLEITNAFQLKIFRKEATKKDISTAMNFLDMDLENDFLKFIGIDNELVYTEAEKVSLNYTQNNGLRSLDILHLAMAKLLNSEYFLTNDKKQSTIAKKMGFKIPL